MHFLPSSLFSILRILGRDGCLDYCVVTDAYYYGRKEDKREEKQRVEKKERMGKSGRREEEVVLNTFYNFAICFNGRLYFDSLINDHFIIVRSCLYRRFFHNI